MKYSFTLIAVCLLLTFIWFRQGNILGGGDAGLFFYSPSISLSFSKISWFEFGTGLSTIGWLSSIPLLYFYSILEKIEIPTFFLQSSYFFVVMSVGVLSMYFLSNFFLKEKNQLTSWIAAIFYLFNPFTMSQVWERGQLTQQTAFGLLPLALLLFALGIKRKSFLFAIFIAVLSVIFSIAFSFLTFVIVFWFVLGSYFLFVVLSSKDKLNIAIFGGKFFSLTLFFWIAASAWWFIPLFLSSGNIYSTNISGLEENLGTLMGVSRNFTPDILIRLLQRTYFFDPSALSKVYSSLLFGFISWIPVVFLIYGLYKIVRLRLKQFYFFIILLIFGLLVSLGANPPFGEVFVFVFKRFPVLQAFRNPFEKFGIVYVLGYSPLFAYGLVSYFANKKYRNLGIALVLVLICVIFAWPMWTGRVVAGPDKKIGLSVPTYYRNLQRWLSEKNEDYRVFMTPLWSGDGAFYRWNDSKFQGSDPMYWILNQPVISNIHFAPFYTEYMRDIRKYMERMDLTGALALLRAKYIVDREDAIGLTLREKEHRKFLTQSIYPPLNDDSVNRKICQDKKASSKADEFAWVVCPIAEKKKDLSNARYLIVDIKTDIPALLEISIRDRKKTAVRWDGRVAKEYRTNDGNFARIILPLSAPTEYNSSIDYSDIEQIDIHARQIGFKDKSVGEISLKEIAVDLGKEEKIKTFHLIKTFGNLKVYEPFKFKAPPEFGVLSSLGQVKDKVGLFEVAKQELDQVDKKGFILESQNQNKNLQELFTTKSVEVIDKQKITSTRYWLKLSGYNPGLVLLSKTFSPQWKLIPDVTRQKLSGNLFNDLTLLQKKPVAEDNHFVVNGYGNLWKTDGQIDEYAIIYMPQVVADIGEEISKYSFYALLVILLFWVTKKYVQKIH